MTGQVISEYVYLAGEPMALRGKERFATTTMISGIVNPGSGYMYSDGYYLTVPS